MEVLYLLNKFDLYRMRDWLIHVFPNIVNQLLQRLALSQRLFAFHSHLFCRHLQYLIIRVLLHRILFQSLIQLSELLFLTWGVTYTCIRIHLLGVLLESTGLLRTFLIFFLAVAHCLVDSLLALLDWVTKALQSLVLRNELLANPEDEVSELAGEEDKLCVLVVALEFGVKFEQMGVEGLHYMSKPLYICFMGSQLLMVLAE